MAALEAGSFPNTGLEIPEIFVLAGWVCINSIRRDRVRLNLNLHQTKDNIKLT